MNKLYVALGGLASLALLTPGDASAFPMGRMGVGPRAFGIGGFSPGGFRGFSPGGFRGFRPGGFRGVSPGGFRGVSPGGFRGFSNGYKPVIGPQNRAYIVSRLQTQRLTNGPMQNRSHRLVDVSSTGSIRNGNVSRNAITSSSPHTAESRAFTPRQLEALKRGSAKPGTTGPAPTQKSFGRGFNKPAAGSGPTPDATGLRGGSGGDAGGYRPGLGSAGSSYYGTNSYAPTNYAANNHDGIADGGAQECAVIRKKKPTKDGGHRWVLVERCERDRE